MSWTNDVVLEFLDHYRIEQVLWDPKHLSHKNRNEVNDAWLRIQNSMSIKCSIMDLKKKKESLMTAFRLHIKRKKKNPRYQTCWFAFSAMENFLGEKYEYDNTNHSDHEYFQNASYSTHIPLPDIGDPQNSSASTERQFTNRRQIKPASSKAQSTDYIFTRKHEDGVHYNKNESDFNMDEYDLYGQLLAKKLRKLDERQRDYAMHEIDNIMFKAKIQSDPLPTKSYPSSPSPVPRKIKSPVFIITAQSNNVQYEDENISYTEQQLS
ncbi:unnamed protein product [Danaus chrysippus]|uniref:(African queen) hypothetical protein n=1 Tax=Danaus chrysippus TaxID=151541 RepID=A0A8J2W5K7_9NEOP|nr:unnamed protein product [Danaus chrysippus]